MSSPLSCPPIADSRLPQTPVYAPGGNFTAELAVAPAAGGKDATGTQDAFRKQVMTGAMTLAPPRGTPAAIASGCHGSEISVNHAEVVGGEGVDSEMTRLLAELRGNQGRGAIGRKHVFDDYMRGRLVSLLAIGLSVRQAGAALGLSHEGVRKELKRNPELLEHVTAARFQAQLEPLLVIIRESRRSWRAATWLVKYLNDRIAAREETPDEARQRSREDEEEFFRRGREMREAERKRVQEQSLNSLKSLKAARREIKSS